MSTEATLAGLDSRRLTQEVERLVSSIEPGDDAPSAVERIAEAVIASLGGELGISGGRIYLRQQSDYRLWSTFGEAQRVSRGTRVPFDYPPLQRCLDQGTVYAAADEPDVDAELERRLGAREFVALEVADRRLLLVFDVDPEYHRDRVLFALALLRYAINQRIREEQIEDVLRQARRIQASILPQSVPQFGRYDIAYRSDPLESVGGDFCDFLPLTDKILGVAIADVSGHGLPAALQVRDIYMGLRMGMARDFKIVRTVERLNQIINLSTLTSRFVSMFYGELEADGTFIYVNAGHPAPFLVSGAREVRYLTEGGVFLGPIPDATYARGFLTMVPGDTLVLYTDGLVEVSCADTESDASLEVAPERLVELVYRLRESKAAAVVDAIFDDVDSCCEGASATDDRTVVVIKR